MAWIIFALIVLSFINFLYSELRVGRQRDSAVNKLTDWLARFETKLEAIYKEARDFYSRERISEAKIHLEKLDELNVEVDNLIAEVYRLLFFVLEKPCTALHLHLEYRQQYLICPPVDSLIDIRT